MTSKYYPGINIQFPISQEIISKKKTVETRTYSIPKKYIGVDLLLIETPGKNKGFRARIVGIIQFGESFKYVDYEEFKKDIHRHLVTNDSPWAWNESKGKWGWPIKKIIRLKEPIPFKGKKGIRFTSRLKLSET